MAVLSRFGGTCTTHGLGRNHRDSDPRRRGRRRRLAWVETSCRAAGSGAANGILRVSSLTSHDLNLQIRRGKIRNFYRNWGKDILGICRPRKVAKTARKTIRNLFVRYLYTEWTRNWSHRTKHGCRFDKPHLPSAFIVSPIRVFPSESGIVPLPQSPLKV